VHAAAGDAEEAGAAAAADGAKQDQPEEPKGWFELKVSRWYVQGLQLLLLSKSTVGHIRVAALVQYYSDVEIRRTGCLMIQDQLWSSASSEESG
jgi:hypothetical protein